MFMSPLFSNSSTFETQAASYRSIAELLWVREAASFQLEEYESYRREKQPDELIIFAIQKGVLHVESESLSGIVQSGQVFFLPQQEQECSLTASQISEGIVIVLCGSIIGQILDGHVRERKLFCPNGLPKFLDAVASLKSDSICVQRVSAIAFQLLMELHRAAEKYEGKPGYPLLVEAAMGIIQEEFAQIDGVFEIAERLGVSESHLIRLFSRHVGISPGRFLKKRRIAYAKELLLQPELPVSLVAELAGFEDANYFSKVFRKEAGMSPSEYAQQYSKTEFDPARRRRIDELYL